MVKRPMGALFKSLAELVVSYTGSALGREGIRDAKRRLWEKIGGEADDDPDPRSDASSASRQTAAAASDGERWHSENWRDREEELVERITATEREIEAIKKALDRQ